MTSRKTRVFFLSESLRRTSGDEKLSDQFGASAGTANQRRRGHLGDPEASVNHQVPHGYFKDSWYQTLVVDRWLQELYRNFALSDFRHVFFSMIGRWKSCCRSHPPWLQWMIWNAHLALNVTTTLNQTNKTLFESEMFTPGSVARRLLFGHHRFGVKDSAIIEEWLWLDAPASCESMGALFFPLWITMGWSSLLILLLFILERGDLKNDVFLIPTLFSSFKDGIIGISY